MAAPLTLVIQIPAKPLVRNVLFYFLTPHHGSPHNGLKMYLQQIRVPFVQGAFSLCL